MCGIFGVVCLENKKISNIISKKKFNAFIEHTEMRGRDSCGYLLFKSNVIKMVKRDKRLSNVFNYSKAKESNVCFGHSRLVTNGLKDNQPVLLNDNFLVHNGIIINHNEIYDQSKLDRKYEIDSEVILSLFNDSTSKKLSIVESIEKILDVSVGTISAVIYMKKENKIVLFSNNGSLYLGSLNGAYIFSSEEYPLKELNCKNINKVYKPKIIDLNKNHSISKLLIDEKNTRNFDLIPSLGIIDGREKLLEYKTPDLKRCSKCILPETMPFIIFNPDGICNYCLNYKIRNKPKPFSDLEKLVEPYRRAKGNDCIIPFSGGRDSFYGLHLAVKKLGMKPITYTYDWGMVTDLARRNISRLCSELEVENIIVADNIKWKRENVKMNIKAWLKCPDLGMVNIFTAGDKHFFRYVQNIKEQTGIKLDLWSINPMEVTHFKSGFLGVKPDFEEEKVYSNGWSKQLHYQKLRLKSMLKSPLYFNRSVFDTIQGEYYRSFFKKKDYFHLFDYYCWEENEINDVIINDYGFEKSPDTSTTWRIGDGTAAFYNYIYYTISGMSEHDTFRSNQIREGQISREKALQLVGLENQPRYQTIVWYLEAIGLDYQTVIRTINSAKKLYKN